MVKQTSVCKLSTVRKPASYGKNIHLSETVLGWSCTGFVFTLVIGSLFWIGFSENEGYVVTKYINILMQEVGVIKRGYEW